MRTRSVRPRPQFLRARSTKSGHPLAGGYNRRVELTGDQAGIAALKALKDKNREYLKFLLGEIRSNTDLKTTFKADDGQAYVVTLEPKSNVLTVEKKS